MDSLTVRQRIEALSTLCKTRDCHEQPYMMVDYDAPLKHVLEPTKEKDDGRRLTMTYHWGLIPHPTGLCYYHLKKREGFFDRKYPLKSRDKDLGIRSLEVSSLAHEITRFVQKSNIGGQHGH